MAYGFSCVNGSNQLTISSDYYLMGYIGKAVFSGRSIASGDDTFSSAGFSTYIISWPGKLIAALGLKSGGQQRIVGTYRVSGTQWAILVRDAGNGVEGPDNLYSGNFTDADVYCWGVPNTPAGYGLALYNSAGVCTADLTRTPLAVTRQVTFGSGVLSASTGTFVRPAIIGAPRTFHSFSNLESGHGGTPWHNTTYQGIWTWDGSTTLSRGDLLDTNAYDDGGIAVVTTQPAVTVSLIETNGLA